MLSWKLSDTSRKPEMLLILSMLMICSAHGSESDENNMLILTGGCVDDIFNTRMTRGICNLVPRHLVKGIYRIKLLNVDLVKDGTRPGILKEYMFGVYLWNIRYLEISSNIRTITEIKEIGQNAFTRLTKLEELHIHLDYLRKIDLNAFSGLSALKTLNLNGCKRLKITDTVVSALSSNQLPLLDNLYLSGTDKVDWYKLTSCERHLRKLNISSTRIVCDPQQIISQTLNITSCTQYQPSLPTLEYLNISATHIERGDLNLYFLTRKLSALTHLDISHNTFERTIWIESKYLKVLNISDIFKGIKHRDGFVMQLDETYIVVHEPEPEPRWNRVPDLVLNGCRNQIVEVFELKENSFTFIDPNALACFKFAKNINLSENKLFMMMKDHSDQFEILFRSLDHLEIIRLSNNNLTQIPASLFQSNTNLRNIDLSSNKLQMINLSLDHLYHLSVLDLQNNEITVLDGALISVIDKLPSGTVVNLNSNPLDCSKCADRSFVSWLVESKQLKHEGLTCLRSKISNYDVDNALVFVQMMCDEEIKLRLSISIPIAFVTLLSIILLIFYCSKKQIRKINRQREIEEIKMMMRENGKFAVFLTYSSNDDEFVKQYVIDNLNQNLKHVIGTDRNLVCEGDRYFRLGKPVMDEMSELLDRSAVLVAVLSNTYCNSVFCRNEFQLAIYKEMPIILMLKEIVDPKNMSPSMRDMFEKKTRVLWEYENGEYKLKTTWLNVCQSVVEMIDIRKLGV